MDSERGVKTKEVDLINSRELWKDVIACHITLYLKRGREDQVCIIMKTVSDLEERFRVLEQ